MALFVNVLKAPSQVVRVQVLPTLATRLATEGSFGRSSWRADGRSRHIGLMRHRSWSKPARARRGDKRGLRPGRGRASSGFSTP